MVWMCSTKKTLRLQETWVTPPSHRCERFLQRRRGRAMGGQALYASAMRKEDGHVLSINYLLNTYSSPRPRTAATSSVQLPST